MIHYLARGEGKPIILIHGMNASFHDWDSLIPAIVSCGFRAVAPDLPGHGESEIPEDPAFYTAGNVFTAVENWLGAMKDSPPYIFIGHSFGGYLGLSLALRHPEWVHAMVLIDPLYSTKQLPAHLSWLKRSRVAGARAIQGVPLTVMDRFLAFYAVYTGHLSPQACLQIAVDFKRASPYNLHILSEMPDLTPELPRVQAPYMVIWGKQDRVLDPSSFPSLVSQLPHASSFAIPRCGHQPHICQPALINQLVADFIQLDYQIRTPNPLSRQKS